MNAGRSLAAAVVAVLLAVTAPSPAHAATVVRDDRSGDAPARIDITAARYSHGDGVVKVLARIPNLGRAGDASLSVSSFDIFEAGYVVRILKRAESRPRVSLLYFDHFDTHRRKCDRVRGRWLDTAIRLSVPVTCLKEHGTRRVFVQFGIVHRGDLDRARPVRNLPRD